MIDIQQKTILYQVIKKYGVKNQLDILTEECAELIQAINKIKRSGLVFPNDIQKPSKNLSIKDNLVYYNLCSEIADVKIMLAQMEIILNSEAIKIAIDRKIERLNKRMNG